MNNRFLLMSSFVVSMIFFHVCCASQQSSKSGRRIIQPRNGVKIQSDLSSKELDLLTEEQRARLDSGLIYLDDFVEEVGSIEVDQQQSVSQANSGAVVKKHLPAKIS